MKRTLALLSLLAAVATGAASAQTSVRLSVGFGNPYVSGFVIVGEPFLFAHPIYIPERRVWVVRRYEYERWQHDRWRFDRGRHRGWDRHADRDWDDRR